MRYEKKKESSENDEMSYAASYKRVISDLYNHTSWLHSYCVINKIASQKITNKAYEICELAKCMDLFLSLEEVNFKLEFLKDLHDINELRGKIVEFYANEFYDGNTTKALEELSSRMRGRTTKDYFSIGIYIGIIFCIMFSIALVDYVGK